MRYEIVRRRDLVQSDTVRMRKSSLRLSPFPRKPRRREKTFHPLYTLRTFARFKTFSAVKL